jgi:Domain of unknown function (DUF4382)
MNSRAGRVLMGLIAAFPLLFWGCSGNSNSSSNNSGSQTGQVSMMVSDDPVNDWAEIGVKVLSISLTPQGGGTPVTVYTAPTTVNMVNLIELDQLADILDNVAVPAGTYTGATFTLSANPGDVALTASSNPDPGFAGTPGEIVPSSQIQILGATGSPGSLTVPLNVTFISPVTVMAGQMGGIDFEFDLSNPAFIVAHAPLGDGTTLWAVDFKPALRHHPIFDITRLVLRQLYGDNAFVSSTNSASMTITRVFPQEPPVNPEQAIPTSRTLTILADRANGTLFYDMDAHTHSTITDFSTVSSDLTGKFLRITARFQSDGSLVAVRIWVSSTFNTVWVSPEGHVRHVLSSSLVVDNEAGVPVTVDISSNTQFFFRTPASPTSDASPICTGTSCLSDLVRGFKVHITCVDPLQTPLVADTVDIEIARFDGTISSPNTTSFVYTRNFTDLTDDYTKTMFYISNSTANGHDPKTGAAIKGYKWWYFAFPTIVDSNVTSSNPIGDFVSATGGSATFGGTVGPVPVVGASFATWNNSANPNGWSVPWTILAPAPVPLATVATTWIQNGNTDSFNISATGGVSQVTVDASALAGSATLVYQVDRTNGIITISPVDLTTPAGQSTIQSNLTVGTPVKVFGVPQTNASIKAYVFFYFTGTMPTS